MRRAARGLAAMVLAIAAIGCSDGKSGEVPKAGGCDAFRALAPSAAADRWAAEPALKACIAPWIAANAPRVTALGTALIERHADDAGVASAVVEALAGQPSSAERAALLREAGEIALERGDDAVAGVALARALEGNKLPGEATLKVQAALAGVRVRQKDWAGAAALYEPVLQRGSPREEDVEGAARAFVGLDRAADAVALCDRLASGDRPPLSLACVRGAGDKLDADKARAAAQRALATYPALSLVEVEKLAPVLDEEIRFARACTADGRKDTTRVLRGVLEGRKERAFDTSVAERLVTGAREGHEKNCYIALVARDCLAKLDEKVACPDPTSLSRYVQVLAETDPSKVRLLMGEIFGAKKAHYEELTRLYGRLNKQAGEVRAAKEVLYNLHLALAYTYDRKPDLEVRVPGDDSRTARYQMRHAAGLWRALYPGQPLPPLPSSLASLAR
ncbi:MAG: hypothetical protein QM820_27760 [Minicystis sp.]